MQYQTNDLEQHWMPFTANREFKSDPRIVVGGNGVYFTDHKGGKVIDGSSGLFCCPLGHGRKEIAEAVYQQLLENDYASPFMTSTPGTFELANRVARITPDPINHVFFVNSGSESIDTALKMVMAYHRARGEGQRTRFVSRERAYHGVNIGGVSLSGMVRNRETFTSVMPNVVVIRHTWTGDELFVRGQPEHGAELADDLARHCETYGGSTIAAVFVEPVAGSTGTLVPPKGYLQRLRKICDEHGILLVFDEIQTGFGRTGKWFAHEHYNVRADLLCIGKGLTSSLPLAALLGPASILDLLSPAEVTTTHAGHPLSCAAALANLDILEEDNLIDQALEKGKLASATLQQLQTRFPEYIASTKGLGLLQAIHVRNPATNTPDEELAWHWTAAAVRRGVMLFHTHRSTLKICPPLIIPEDALVEGIVALGEALDDYLHSK